jgi:hypothetical protein
MLQLMTAEQPISHDPRILLPGEAGFNLEQRPITMQSLWEDNHSQKANRRRARFDEDERNHDLVTIFRCSDSRYIITYRGAIAISTIAAGGPKKQFEGICSDQSSRGILILPHENCGGLGFKSILEEFGLPEDADEVANYLDNPNNVPTSDPGAMALLTARIVSRIIPDKPVLASVHNHETGDIFPLVAYYGGKPDFSAGVPNEFARFFNAQGNYVANLKTEIPNLKQIQEKQDKVKLVAIVRSRRPLESILPETTRIPGSTFRIVSSRPEDGDLTRIDPDDAKLVMGQARYPFDHFDATLNRVLIAMERMETAREMATMLFDKQYTKAFAAKPGTEVYIAQTNNGVIEKIEKFPLDLVA